MVMAGEVKVPVLQTVYTYAHTDKSKIIYQIHRMEYMCDAVLTRSVIHQRLEPDSKSRNGEGATKKEYRDNTFPGISE